MPKYNVVSADSHLEITPERWTDRVPAKWRDRAPKTVALSDGGNAILVEGKALHPMALTITGTPFEQQTLKGVEFEGKPGTGTPEERIKEQDQDGVNAEILYTSPGNTKHWRGIYDDAIYNMVVHAYNEFLAEDYCAGHADRLIAMAVIPTSTLDAAVKEMEYCSKAGLKGVMISTFPSGKGYPTAEDDRFWAAALDLNVAVTAHVGFVTRQGPYFQYPKVPKLTTPGGPGADAIRSITRYAAIPGEATTAIIQMIAAGVFERFKKLRIYFAETQIGWLPSGLEQMDDTYERHRWWMERDYGVPQFKKKPSEYFLEHTLWGFLYDKFGVKYRNDMNIDNLMWGNDFPHSAGNWPNSPKILEDMFQGVPPAERQKLVCDNAVRFFRLDNA
jgi:predicted TIM-barrel fold metal-dependent hydrolase